MNTGLRAEKNGFINQVRKEKGSEKWRRAEKRREKEGIVREL